MKSICFEKVSCSIGHTLRDPTNQQSMHSFIGPELEAQLIYLEPSRLSSRLSQNSSIPLVLWDVGMGIAANSLMAWKLAESPECQRPIEIHSFELHPEALQQALENLDTFPFLKSHEDCLRELLATGEVHSTHSIQGVLSRWVLHRGDFREFLSQLKQSHVPQPALIYWDFYSPKTCPELWSVEIFTQLRSVAPQSLLFTYSAATPVRVGLLLAGFIVGRPDPSRQATPMKSEATLAAANSSHRLEVGHLLDQKWLEKLSRSSQFRPYAGPKKTMESSYQEIAEILTQLEQFRFT